MRSLKQVLRELVRRHGPRAAAEPIDAVVASLGATEGAVALRGLARAAGGRTLGAVLEDPAAQVSYETQLAPAERSGLLRALARWSSDRDAVARARSQEQVRELAEKEERALVRWARGKGVLDLLDAPLEEVADRVDLREERSEYTLRAAARGTVADAILRRTRVAGMSAEALEKAARGLLESEAAHRATVARRTARWARPPEHAGLARLAAVLAERSASYDGEVEAAPPPVGATFDARTLTLAAPSGAGDEISLDLSDYEAGELRVRHGPGRETTARTATFADVRMLIAEMRDACHDTSHPLHAALRAAIEVPAWQRKLDHLGASASPRPEMTSRIVFRVTGRRERVGLTSLLQHMGARGTWRKGTPVQPNGAGVWGLTSPASAAALAVLASDGAAAALFVLALERDACAAEERAVVVDEDGAPLSVSRVEAAFAFHERDGALRPGLSIGGAHVEPGAPDVMSHRNHLAYLTDDRRVLVAEVSPVLARMLAASRGWGAGVPSEHRHAVLPMLERAAASAPVVLPPSLERELEALAVELVVRVEPRGASDFVAEFRARLGPGRSARAGVGSSLVAQLDRASGRPVLFRRDLETEGERARALASELGLAANATLHVLADEDALCAMLEALTRRPDVEVEWPNPALGLRYAGALPSSFQIVVGKASQWFNAGGTVEVDGQQVTLRDLLAQVRAGRRYVRLAGGSFAAIQDELRARLERVADVVFDHEGGLGVAISAGDVLDDLASEGGLVADEEWTRARERIRNATLHEAAVPSALRATLREYQVAGFSWLARLASIEAGAVLADDMGLGKTVQALALLLHRAAGGPALVIAPTSLGDNWAREAAHFAPSLRVRVHRGPERHRELAEDPPRAGDLIVCSYDVATLDIEALSQIEFDTLVIDEAQALKNPDALRTKAARRVRARFRVALTGTPLENRLADLWSIVSIVHPGLLGTWPHFRARFGIPIERDGDREQLAQLTRIVRPYLLRRTKEAVTPELPPRIELLRHVELDEGERGLYEAERDDAIARAARGFDPDRFALLASITRLRQLACDASLVVPDAIATSSKVAATRDLLEELASAGRQVLVFSQFVRLLDRLAGELDTAGVRYLRLDGATPAAERASLVSRFQAGEASAFLLSLKAGGVGLNLTAADHVVHLDPWWNPAVEDQASDRAHRIGQDKPVTIVRVVSRDTIEETVLDLHERKRALARGVLDGADAAGALSASELIALIRGDEVGRGRRGPAVDTLH